MEQERFEDFVGLISAISKEIQRIKTREGAKLGLKGADIMCLYYLAQHEEGLPAAALAREAEVTRAAVSRTLAHLEEEGLVEVEVASGEAATRYRAPIRLTERGRACTEQAVEVIRSVVAEAGAELGEAERTQMYASLAQILNRLKGMSRA